MFFDNWHSLWRITIVAVLAYSGLILFLRVSGTGEVEAVILETNGNLSVIRRSESRDTSALDNVTAPGKPRSEALPDRPKP